MSIEGERTARYRPAQRKEKRSKSFFFSFWRGTFSTLHFFLGSKKYSNGIFFFFFVFTLGPFFFPLLLLLFGSFFFFLLVLFTFFSFLTLFFFLVAGRQKSVWNTRAADVQSRLTFAR